MHNVLVPQTLKILQHAARFLSGPDQVNNKNPYLKHVKKEGFLEFCLEILLNASIKSQAISTP